MELACFVHSKATLESDPTFPSSCMPKQRRLQAEPFDLVLIVDESGSMDETQESLRENIFTLFQELANKAPNSRVGLVGYGTDRHDSDHQAHINNHTALTSNETEFQEAADALVASNTADEPSYQAIIDSLNGTLSLGYFPNRPFCMALFTDDISYGGSIDEAKDLLTNDVTNEANASGTFFAVVEGHDDTNLTVNLTEQELREAYEPLVNATDGAFFSLSAFEMNTTELLNELVEKCSTSIPSTFENITTTPTTQPPTTEENITTTPPTTPPTTITPTPLPTTEEENTTTTTKPTPTPTTSVTQSPAESVDTTQGFNFALIAIIGAVIAAIIGGIIAFFLIHDSSDFSSSDDRREKERVLFGDLLF